MTDSVPATAAHRDLGGHATAAELGDLANLIDPAERRPEARPTRVEQIEASGSPTRRMMHDFNNLLGIITLNLELARARASGGEVREMIDEALDAAWQGSALTGRLAEYARSWPGQAERVESGGPAAAAQAGPGSL